MSLASVLQQPLAVSALALVLSALLAAWLLPLIIRLAHRYDLLDYPDGERHLHRRPVPRLGGVAVVLSTMLASTIMVLLHGSAEGLFDIYGSTTWAVFWASVVVFMVGLADDLAELSPMVKLAGQAAAAALVINAGVRIDEIAIAPGARPLALGWLAGPITFLWLVGATNAFNLIDGLDGLAAACGIVALGTILFASEWLHPDTPFIVVAAMLGAILVFYRHNRHPARIFLGDAGALTIGFFIAVRAVIGAQAADGRILVLIPIVALAYPLLDTGIAILRRFLRGDRITAGDHRHIHHRLGEIGLRTHQVVQAITMGALVIAVAGLSITFAPARLTAGLLLVVGMGLATLLFYAPRWLGYNEFVIFWRSVASILRRSRTTVAEGIRIAEVAERLRAARDEAEVHAILQGLEDGVHAVQVALLPMDQLRNPTPPPGAMIYAECPVRGSAPGGYGWSLVVWVTREGLLYHTGGRILGLIGPALEQWFADRGAVVTTPRLQVARPTPDLLVSLESSPRPG